MGLPVVLVLVVLFLVLMVLPMVLAVIFVLVVLMMLPVLILVLAVMPVLPAPTAVPKATLISPGGGGLLASEGGRAPCLEVGSDSAKEGDKQQREHSSV